MKTKRMRIDSILDMMDIVNQRNDNYEQNSLQKI